MRAEIAATDAKTVRIHVSAKNIEQHGRPHQTATPTLPSLLYTVRRRAQACCTAIEAKVMGMLHIPNAY